MKKTEDTDRYKKTPSPKFKLDFGAKQGIQIKNQPFQTFQWPQRFHWLNRPINTPYSVLATASKLCK